MFEYLHKMNELTDLRIKKRPRTSNEYITTYIIKDTDKTKTNRHLIDKCDLFLIAGSFVEGGLNNIVCDKWDDLPYKWGIGVIIKKDKKRIKEIMKSIDWYKYSFRGLKANDVLGAADIIIGFEDNYNK